MIRADKLGLLGFVLILFLATIRYAFDSSGPEKAGDSGRRPVTVERQGVRRPAPQVPVDVLPPISADDPALQIAPSRKGNSTGTAFSIGDGVWMTARHVLDGCAAFGILTGRKRVERGHDAVLNPRHDLAIFRTERAAPVMGIEPAAVRRDQHGFHYGYPQGKPADIHSRLLGRMTAVPAGRGHREPVVAWAEIRRYPQFTGSLGGISGGPVVDRTGNVIGVTVAGSARRGRVVTTAASGVRDMLNMARIRPVIPDTAMSTIPVGEADFPNAGNQLRRDLSVVKVVCWVD